MQIKETCKPIRKQLDDYLFQRVPSDEKPLFHAARYVLENQAKRMRPMLVILTALDLSVSIEKALPAAAALEMVHNYSLIHDDLPCMDDDDMRRGRPSVHKAFCEATAVLLGDFFLTHSFTSILESDDLTSDEKVNLTQALAHYSGGRELLEGQMLDLSMEGKIGHYYDLLNIYLRKTSSLMCCALEFAAILGHEPKSRDLLREVGQKIGLAFQIQNDFQGKKKDGAKDKFTIFALHSEQQAKLLIQKNIHEALEVLESSEHVFEHLKAYIRFIFNYEI